METFDENRIQNDGIIQQTQNTHYLSKIPESKAKWAEMIALFWLTGLRDVYGTSQGLYNPQGQMELELEKIRSISGLACLSDKGCFSRSRGRHMGKRPAHFLWITSLPHFRGTDPGL